MNIAVTIFYALAGAWLVALTSFAIYKKVKQKKAHKQIEKQLEDERKQENNEVNSEN